MKNCAAILIVCFLVSCKKNPSIPTTPKPIVEMEYTNLNDREVKYQQNAIALDVNKDNKTDLLFGTMLVGDFIYKIDKLRFLITSSIYTALPINSNEQIPVINANSAIPLNNFGGTNWYSASEIVLMERQETLAGNISWNGNWLGAEKKYLPFQFYQNNKRYNGWIELTANSNLNKLVLHRIAISKQAEVEIIAGK